MPGNGETLMACQRKNEPLTTQATLRRTARATKHEETRCAHARKLRRTSQRTKDHNAGRPKATQRAEPEKGWNVPLTTQLQRKAALTSNAGVKRRAAFSRVRLDELLCQPQSKTQHRKLTRGRRQQATLVRWVKNGPKPPPMQKRQTRARR